MDIDLNVIENRTNAAYPGPWKWDHDWGMNLETPIGEVIHCAMSIHAASCDFIVHAREDVPNLISRIRELEEELKKAYDRGYNDGYEKTGRSHLDL